MESFLDEARAVIEKLTEASRAMDEALNSFFEGLDVGMLEDYSSFGHIEIPKRDALLRSGGPSSSPKLEK